MRPFVAMAEMTDLQERLQRSIGDRYRIARELTGGGMSRLFLATEPSLGREVVIKVLPPELASEVSAARFQREIELAARFQHPNIVPVLAGGASEGLLFYVMPFVRGESLRRLLESGQPIAVPAALTIVEEVADALAYAHSQGVVHRDLKPENILLAAGHAMVTDFGVAGALAVARSGDRLTGTGTSVGSPGYMAPEQLAGDGTVDARTDQYALGCVAYELIAGKAPFKAAALKDLVVAHLTRVPPPLQELRGEVSPNTASAVARALAKDPADRFPDIATFRRELVSGARPHAAPARRMLRRFAISAVAIAALIVLGVFLANRSRTATPALDENLIAVAPFTVLEPSLAIWREGMVDVLARKLDGAGPLRAVPPSVSVRRFSGRADNTSAEALGRATGAGLAIFGTLYAQGADSARIEATLYDVREGRVVADVVLADATSQLARLTDSVTVHLVRELGRGVPRLSSLTTSSLSALKEFLQGEQYYRRSAWDSAVAHYERASALDSAFVLPLLRLTYVYGWKGSLTDAKVIALSEQTFQRARGLSLHDSLLVRAVALEGQAVGPAPPDLPGAAILEAFRLGEEAMRVYPQSQDAAMQHVDAIYHVGIPVHRGNRRELRTRFDRIIEMDSSFTPAYLHPINISFELGDTAAAHRYARLYLARTPTDDDAAAVRALDAVLSASRPPAAFTTLIDTASYNLLRSIGQLTFRWLDADETSVRITAQALARARATGSIGTPSRILAQSLALRGHLSEAAKYVPDGLAGTSVLVSLASRPLALELALLGGLSPDVADSLFSRIAAEPLGVYTGYLGIPYFALRRDTVALQKLRGRIDSLALTSRSPTLARVLAGGARAYLALARGDSASALREFETLPDSLMACAGCHVWHLTHAQLLSRAGRVREAYAILQTDANYWNTPVGVLWTLERARVREQLGDRDLAREDYAMVVAAWRDPDTSLKAYVDEARQALTRLSADAPRGGMRP